MLELIKEINIIIYYQMLNSLNGIKMDGLVTFSEVKLQEAILEDIITNGNFDNNGWTVWHEEGTDAFTYDLTNGTFNITTDSSGSANWAVQFNQSPITLEADTTYVFSFDAMATAARDINVKLFVPNVWVNQIEMLNQMLTTEMATYTYEFTTGTEFRRFNIALN